MIIFTGIFAWVGRGLRRHLLFDYVFKYAILFYHMKPRTMYSAQ